MDFQDCYAHLGNLFVAVGITELSNKIASFRIDQKVFIRGKVCLLM
jgi:hypothetical protein